MSILVDLIILAIIALCVWGGYRKGLIGVAFKILSFLVAIVIAAVLYKPVGSLIIQNTNWDETITQSIIESSKAQIEQENPGENIDNADPITQAIVEYVNNNLENAVNQTKENLANEFAGNIAETIIYAGTFVALFLIANIVLVVLKLFANLVAKLPILNQFNKIGGVAFGLIKGILIVYLLLAILSVVAPIIDANSIVKPIQQSMIGKVMYENNLLINIIF